MRDQTSKAESASSVAGTVLDVDTSSAPDHTLDKGDDLIGHIFVGRYQIEKQIASGTMGRVYLGTQLKLERPVAIKILKQWGNAIDPRFAKRFCREASIASQLAHPNIVSIYDYGETDDGRLFMVMEYLEGVPLVELIREQAPFSAERTLSIIIQIARALRRAHGVGVVHRDLKPANVMVKTDEEGFDFIKVLDFGLVKLFAPDESPVTAPDDEEHLTRPGNMVGTPDYVSPEQALGDRVDGRTDIYSLGVLMFQMMSGRLPFVGGSIIDMVKQHLNSPVPAISEVAPEAECPEELEQIIRRAMSKVRDERYRSMDELLLALKSAWRNVTDESYGTEVSSASLMPELMPAPIAEGGWVPMDPSETSRPPEPMPNALRRASSLRRVASLLPAAFLLVAAACGAYWWSATRGSETPVVIPVSVSAAAPVVIAPVVSAPVVSAPVVANEAAPEPKAPVERAAAVERGAAVEVERGAAVEEEAPVKKKTVVPAPAPASVKRAKRVKVYKDNPF